MMTELTLSGSVETLTARGDSSCDLMLSRLGSKATPTARATPSLARAGSGGSPTIITTFI